MSMEGTDHYFVRCSRPGCMAGYLGWNEPCEECGGTGWVSIPETQKSKMFRAAAGYLTFVVGMAVFMWLLFR